ncbi:MAG: hypothetical protein VZR56_02695 [Treponema sp.]|nr:hypothetical protein [Treponema sp.]
MLEDFFDDETEPVVKPEAFYGPQKFVTDKCLIIFSKVIHDHLLSHCKCEQVALIKSCNGNIPIYAMEYKGEKICFYLSSLGSAMAAARCYEAHWLTGVQAACDFYGLSLYDFLEAGDVLSENDYDVKDLDNANHDLAKLFIALDVALRAILL